MTKPVRGAQALRGTQTLVGQMSWAWMRPVLTLIEVGWRWLFGVPFLIVVAREMRRIFHELPPVQFGLTNLDSNNPWQIAQHIGEAWRAYTPFVVDTAKWLLPTAALAWIVLSALGRSLIVWRMEPKKKWRPISFVFLQAAQLLTIGLVLSFWWWLMGGIAADNIYIDGEPNLTGYLISVVLLTLTTFVAWALISWPVMVAPVLVAMEGLSPWRALGQSVRLGKGFTSKLVEINLVMGIVRLALMVLAAVLSAAPLPFGEQIGNSSLRTITMVAIVFNFVANDYFQVVRLKSFVEFWYKFRGAGEPVAD